MENTTVTHRLLKILKQVDIVNDFRMCHQVWAEILHTETDVELMLAMGKLMQLTVDFSDEIENIYPKFIPQKDKIVNKIQRGLLEQKMTDKFQTFKSHIDDSVIDYLEILADMPELQNKNVDISFDELDLLNEEIRSIIDDITESSVDNDIKFYVIKSLRNIVRSIEDYTLTGIHPILDSIDMAMGHVFTDEKYRKFIKEDKFGHKISKVLSETANIITVFLGVPQIGQSFNLLLDVK